MSEWQPTEEEVAAGISALFQPPLVMEWSNEGAVRRILAAVGPAIAARALREAAGDHALHATTDADERLVLLLRAHADRIEAT